MSVNPPLTLEVNIPHQRSSETTLEGITRSTIKITALSLQIMDGRLTDGRMPTHRPKTRYNQPLGSDLCVIGHGI